MSVRCRLVDAGNGRRSRQRCRGVRDDSKHGCLHELLGTTFRLLPAVPSAQEAERLARGGCSNDRDELTRFWPVIQNLVTQELRVRYQRSILGFFWTLLNPLLMMADPLVGLLAPRSTASPNYTLYLFAGMVPWGFLSGSLNECAGCIIMNEGLIRKIYVPKLVFPLSRVLINLVTLLLSLVALFLLLWPFGRGTAVEFDDPPAGGDRSLRRLHTGAGADVATANTFYRDCGHLVSVFLQAWYFATPILYQGRGLSGGGAVAVPAQSGLLLPRPVPRHRLRRTLAAGRFAGRRRRDRDGQPGDRLCHIQVARRQDGIPTLSRRGGGLEPRDGLEGPAADRAARRLAPVHQLRRQAVLAQARGARPGAPPRVARAGLRLLGLAGHQPADPARRAGRHRRRQRRRQEHACSGSWHGSIRRRRGPSRFAATSHP